MMEVLKDILSVVLYRVVRESCFKETEEPFRRIVQKNCVLLQPILCKVRKTCMIQGILME